MRRSCGDGDTTPSVDDPLVTGGTQAFTSLPRHHHHLIVDSRLAKRLHYVDLCAMAARKDKVKVDCGAGVYSGKDTDRLYRAACVTMGFRPWQQLALSDF